VPLLLTLLQERCKNLWCIADNFADTFIIAETVAYTDADTIADTFADILTDICLDKVDTFVADTLADMFVNTHGVLRTP
jgi:hypothetical protein